MKRYAIEIIEHANAPTRYIAMKKGWLWGWNDLLSGQVCREWRISFKEAESDIKEKVDDAKRIAKIQSNFKVVKTTIQEVKL